MGTREERQESRCSPAVLRVCVQHRGTEPCTAVTAQFLNPGTASALREMQALGSL